MLKTKKLSKIARELLAKRRLRAADVGASPKLARAVGVLVQRKYLREVVLAGQTGECGQIVEYRITDDGENALLLDHIAQDTDGAW